MHDTFENILDNYFKIKAYIRALFIMILGNQPSPQTVFSLLFRKLMTLHKVHWQVDFEYFFAVSIFI